MKKNFYKIMVAILIILVFGFGFYWYELRPSMIIKKCSLQSEFSQQDINFLKALKKQGVKAEEALTRLKAVKSKTQPDTTTQRQDNYQKCLTDNGLRE